MNNFFRDSHTSVYSFAEYRAAMKRRRLRWLSFKRSAVSVLRWAGMLTGLAMMVYAYACMREASWSRAVTVMFAGLYIFVYSAACLYSHAHARVQERAS